MNYSLGRIWMTLATVALLLSGFLALIVTGAKAPMLKEYIANLDLIRWCLVVHVNLATLVWFTALPAGLIHLAIGDRIQESPESKFFTRLGFGAAVAGVALMLSVPPSTNTEIILANYIPVLGHPRYFFALALYILGVTLSLLSPWVLRPSPRPATLGLDEVRFGLAVGSLFFIAGAATLGHAYFNLGQIQLVTSKTYFELGMWGGGHLLQHASATFLLCCWVILLSSETGKPILTRSQLFPYFAALGLPVLAVPALWLFPVNSGEYRAGFTLLMQWGIAPVSLLLLYRLVKAFSFSRESFKSYRVIAFVFSALLLLLGFVFGALIRGADMRVPGHYHAGIGAVTLIFMATALHVLSRGQVNRWMKRMSWTYGCGQIVFAGGMFIAGSFGMGRKTYGAEHILSNWGQKLGFFMMAAGGLVAFTGGLLFALAVIPYLRNRNPIRISSAPKPCLAH